MPNNYARPRDGSAPRLPRYPIYIPSKGRVANCLTPGFLQVDEVPFHLVVEPQEEAAYRARFPDASILVLPRDNGGLIFSRNWIKDHATAAGAARHWQLDDNMRALYRRWRSKRLYCNAGIGLAACEDFTDRYENVAVSGLNYVMFAPDNQKMPPFNVNVHVYSCSLILNSLPNRWRSPYNDDTDFCLQVLADGWCTLLLNAFLVQKMWTMSFKGGNTADLYQGDGRLRMARSLERLWPGVVTTKRRYGRPQHVVKDNWRRFDTPLRLRPDLDPATLATTDAYGMELRELKPLRSPTLRALVGDVLVPYGEAQT